MMESWLLVFLITLGYLLVSLLIGLYSGRRTSESTLGFVAGDRALGTLVLYFVMGASIFSAFAFLGGPGWAYSRGAAAFYILSYGTVGLVPWYFFGPQIAQLGRRFGYVTQAEFFAHRFQSRLLSALLALISLAAFLPYLTLQMQGAGYVFSVVTEGRVPVWAGAAIAYAVVLIYVFHSGVMGVAWTNTFQGILMMGLAWCLGLYLPYKLYGGVTQMFEQLAATAPDMLKAPGLGPSGELWTWGGYSSAIVVSALGFSLWPHYFMKIYTARDIRTLKKTIVFYPTFQVFLVPIMFIGFAGVIAFPNVSPADSILPTIVTSLGLPAVVVGLFCAGALAASMSSGDAIVHAAASIVVKDLCQKLVRTRMDPHRERRLIRYLVIVIGATAYYFAVISKASLVYLLLLSYGAITQLFPLLLASLIWPRSTRPGVLAGLLAGCAVTVLWNLFPVLQWQQIHPGVWGLAANTVCLIVVSLSTPPMEEAHVCQFIEG
ncbi:MAG: sodium:solute symporter [Acidobacteriota bacterium]